ncbi:Ribonuclease III [Lymphocystis disease virus 1]|uniref:Ribonuclease III n=1 Tax=Fish lymphocystis disease virus TaxID=36363 RepID=UPI0000161EC8|nr:Ribonuclease III [Lymphocystis disease virus 1]
MEKWLISLFKNKFKINTEYISVLIARIDKELIQAFTPASVDPIINYESFEILGDGVAAYFLPMYFYKTFPQLQNAKGVKAIARLKINYASRRSFATIAKFLGFWPYIKKPKNLKCDQKKLLEDVFESFLGAVCLILDGHFNVEGVGAAVCFNFLKNIFDTMTIEINYKALFDPKTRLKELMDIYTAELGVLAYRHFNNKTDCYIGDKLMITVYGSNKKDREQDSSDKVLELLEKQGYVLDRDLITVSELTI